MPLDKHSFQYIGAYVSTDAAVSTYEARIEVPGNVSWVDAMTFPIYEGVASNTVLLRFRTPNIDAVLKEFKQLAPVHQNGYGRRTVVVGYDGVPVEIEESAPAPSANQTDYSYHSFWIPRTEAHVHDIRLSDAMMYVNSRPNPFGIGWVRYDSDAPYDSIIHSLPHVALTVDNVSEAVVGRKVLIPPKQTQPGLRVAFVESGGFPIEFVEIDPEILPNGI